MVTTDAELARELARAAGQLLIELRRDFGPVDPADRVGLRELRDTADRASHEFIVARLAQARPTDAVLSEEGKDGIDRDTAERVWIVDPLDGTSEYGQGRSDFAVHVALWDRAGGGVESWPDATAAAPGTALVAGCVDLPAQAVTYSSNDATAGGARPEAKPHRSGAPVRVIISRTRPPALALDADRLGQLFAAAGIDVGGIEVQRVGSVGAKVGELLAGRADLYLHDSGFYEWDVAAPLVVAQRYGLRACHLDGATVTFNHRPPWVRDLVVGKSELVAALAPAGVY